jgi:hypothetical protein
MLPNIPQCTNLACHSPGTHLSESQGRVDFTQEIEDVDVFDATSGLRIVLTPETNELTQMMSTQNGDVSCEVVKVVHYNSHEQVQNLKPDGALEQWGRGGMIALKSAFS